MIVGKNRIVSIHYIMRNSRGEVLENTMDNQPTHYLQGSEGILACLQSQLEGLRAGDRKMVVLPKEISSTYGDYSFEVRIRGVREASEQELLLGYPVIADCPEDCDCYISSIDPDEHKHRV